MGNSFLFSDLVYSGSIKLTRRKIEKIAAKLLWTPGTDKAALRNERAELTFDSDIPVDILPAKPVFKLGKQEHIDQFFKDGTLKLGTFSYYGQFDHDEIGDKSEGNSLLVGRCPQYTIFAKISSGSNYFSFCCYSGEPDSDVRSEFGYHSRFRILPPG